MIDFLVYRDRLVFKFIDFGDATNDYKFINPKSNCAIIKYLKTKKKLTNEELETF